MSVDIGSDVIGGELVGTRRRRSRAYAPGRTCAREGCSTRLSIYNGSRFCAAHDFNASLVHTYARRSDKQEGSGPRVIGHAA